MSAKDRLEKALLDPADVFASPAEVLSDAALTRAQKIEILRRWEYDAAELGTADDEGMAGEAGPLLRQVLLALESLGVSVDPA